MNTIIHFVQNLFSAWMEARSEQAKYYSKHGHIE